MFKMRLITKFKIVVAYLVVFIRNIFVKTPATMKAYHLSMAR